MIAIIVIIMHIVLITLMTTACHDNVYGYYKLLCHSDHSNYDDY